MVICSWPLRGDGNLREGWSGLWGYRNLHVHGSRGELGRCGVTRRKMLGMSRDFFVNWDLPCREGSGQDRKGWWP